MTIQLIKLWVPDNPESDIPMIAGNDDAIWDIATPCRVDDGHGGSLMLLENIVVCPGCGGLAAERMLYCWDETSDEYRQMRDSKGEVFHTIQDGDSIKHLSTICFYNCGHDTYS